MSNSMILEIKSLLLNEITSHWVQQSRMHLLITSYTSDMSELLSIHNYFQLLRPCYTSFTVIRCEERDNYSKVCFATSEQL